MPDITICADWLSRIIGVVGLVAAVATLIYARAVARRGRRHHPEQGVT